MTDVRVSDLIQKLADSDYFNPRRRTAADLGRLVLDDKMKPGEAARYWTESAAEEAEKPVRPEVGVGGAALGGAVMPGLPMAYMGGELGDDSWRRANRKIDRWLQAKDMNEDGLRFLSEALGGPSNPRPSRWKRVAGGAGAGLLAGTLLGGLMWKGLSKGRRLEDEASKERLQETVRKFQEDPKAGKLEAKSQKKNLKRTRKQQALDEAVRRAVEERMDELRWQDGYEYAS